MALRAFRFPMLFLPDGNLSVQEESRASLETAQTSVMVQESGIPFSEVGTLVPLMAFEPPDDVSLDVVAYQAARGLAAGAPSIRLQSVEQKSTYPHRYKIGVRDDLLDASDASFTLISGPLGYVVQ